MMRSGRISFVVNVRSTRPEAMYPTISVPPRIVTSASLSSTTPLHSSFAGTLAMARHWDRRGMNLPSNLYYLKEKPRSWCRDKAETFHNSPRPTFGADFGILQHFCNPLDPRRSC
jgi:hypothetical protein